MRAIRPATPTDAADIVRVVNLAYQMEEFFVRGSRTSEEEIRDLMTRGRFLVLDEDDGVAGCVYLELRGPRAYLGMLSIDPARQGGGRGTRLVEAAEGVCRAHGCRNLDLTVVSVRPELFSYYGKLGFVPTGETLPWPEPGSERLKIATHFIVYTKAL